MWRKSNINLNKRFTKHSDRASLAAVRSAQKTSANAAWFGCPGRGHATRNWRKCMGKRSETDRNVSVAGSDEATGIFDGAVAGGSTSKRFCGASTSSRLPSCICTTVGIRAPNVAPGAVSPTPWTTTTAQIGLSVCDDPVVVWIVFNIMAPRAPAFATSTGLLLNGQRTPAGSGPNLQRHELPKTRIDLVGCL